MFPIASANASNFNAQGAIRPEMGRVGNWVHAVEQVKGLPWERFLDRHGDNGRDLARYLGRELAGLPLREMVRHAEVSGLTGASMALKRFSLQLSKERDLRRLVQKARAHLSGLKCEK